MSKQAPGRVMETPNVISGSKEGVANETYFTLDDFYPLQVLKKAIYPRLTLGIYKKTSKIDISADVWTEIPKGHLELMTESLTIVFDLRDLDVDRFVMSCLFWTRNARVGMGSVMTDGLQQWFVNLIGAKDPVWSRSRLNQEVESWDGETLSAAIMYCIKKLSKHSRNRYVLILHLAILFLGAGGWGNRGGVFGTDPNNVYSPEPIASEQFPDYFDYEQYLLAKYNKICGMLGALRSAVAGANRIISDGMIEMRCRNTVTIFLKTYCYASDWAAEYVWECLSAKGGRTVFALIRNIDKIIPKSEKRLYYAIGTLMNHLAAIEKTEYPVEKCPFCWLSQRESVRCKYHSAPDSEPLKLQQSVQQSVQQSAQQSVQNIESVKIEQFPSNIQGATAPPLDQHDTLIIEPLPDVDETLAVGTNAPVVSMQQISPTVQSAENDALACTICYNARIDTRLDPCGHMYCTGCAAMASFCYHCRQKVEKTERTYIV